MARYIDAEALTDYMLGRYNDLCEKYGDYDHYTTGYGDAIDAIENAPTADVVPKSEVKETVEKLMSATDKVICEAKQEVAREIFEEIEKICTDFPLYGNPDTLILSEHDFAELKKKYTQEG